MAGPRPNAIVFTIGGPIARSDLPALCERVRRLLERSGADVLLCDVGELVEPDAVAIDALARLQLAARRAGCRARLRHAPDELRELLTFVGLNGVVPRCFDAAAPAKPARPRGGIASDALGLGRGGQAEKREQLLGAEEERQLDDATP